MFRERLVQLICVVLAIACFIFSGRMLPRMNVLTGEQYLMLTIEKPTDALATNAVQRRVPISKIYQMETTRAVERGEALTVMFDGGLRKWEGHIGDEIALTWRTSEPVDTA